MVSLTSGNNDVDLLGLLWDLGVQPHGMLELFEAQQTTWAEGKKEKRRVLTLACTLALMSCTPVLGRLASGCSQHTLQEANPNFARLTGISTNLSVAQQVSFGAPFVSSCDASWFSHQAPSCSSCYTVSKDSDLREITESFSPVSADHCFCHP